MTTYIVRRLAGLVALLAAISVLVFLLIRLIPGDPATAILGQGSADPQAIANLRQQMGLDRPIYQQYFDWLAGLVQGDLGYSYTQQQPVGDLIIENLGPTVALTLSSLVVLGAFGLLLGILAALHRGRRVDTIVMTGALAFMSLPSFWLGTILLLIFAVWLGWFDVVGGTGPMGLVLPSVTLALGGTGFLARFVRSSVVDVSGEKFVLTATAKGISRRRVVWGHIVRNGLLPVITVLGLQLGNLLSGTVIVETVFSRPGLGRLLVDAINQKDYLTVQAIVLLIAAAYATVNTVVDLFYPVLDPRVALR